MILMQQHHHHMSNSKKDPSWQMKMIIKENYLKNIVFMYWNLYFKYDVPTKPTPTTYIQIAGAGSIIVMVLLSALQNAYMIVN